MEKHVEINNGIYDTLGEKWYTADDDPVALLRAESKIKCKWVEEKLEKNGIKKDQTILDVGCGAGFISNHFSRAGFSVTGLDISQESLQVAKRYDQSNSVNYVHGNAYSLPFQSGSFDIITSMDFLEHVTDPKQAIFEMARVLRPGGYLFFHTFNRNPLSYLLVIKAVEWFVKNTPPHMHLYNMFILPQEMAAYCIEAKLDPLAWTGIKPVFSKRAFWHSLFTGVVHKEFSFETCSSTRLSYMGMAKKIEKA